MGPTRTTAKGAARVSPISVDKPVVRRLKATELTQITPPAVKVGKKRASAATAARDNLLNSEFARHEPPLSPSTLGDLSNRILPLFKKTNFPRLTPEEYKVIQPSLRLASQLLKHSSLQPLLRTIVFHGPLQPLDMVDPDDGKSLFEYPIDSNPITPTDTANNIAALGELRHFVKFSMKLVNFNGNAAATKPLNGKKPPKNTRTKIKHLHAIRSSVKIPSDVLKHLVEATDNFPSTQDVPALLGRRFHLAVDLVHEVCHALGYATDGHLKEYDTEPLMPGARIGEIGFTTEQTLLSGHFEVLWHKDKNAKMHEKSEGELSDFIGLPVLFDWPSSCTVKDYAHHNLCMSVRQGVQDSLPEKEVAWRVPMSDLARFFKTEFWEQEPASLALERKVGFAFTSDRKGAVRKFCDADEDVVPKGYKVSKHSAIVYDK